MSSQNRWEHRSSPQLQGQKMLSTAVPDKYTHILHFSSFHGRLPPQISFCDPHPTVFLSSSFFLWLQTGFEAKAAFDPSRFVNLPTNLPISTSNFTITQRWSSTPFIRFQRCSITETGRWKEIFFHEQKIEKRFAGPEIKMPHMRTSVLQPLKTRRRAI